MSEPLLSVVIPTRDRLEVLKATLDALGRSEGIEGEFEVLVVDDGSSDSTPSYLAGACLDSFAFKGLSIPHAGPAAARNRALELARADRVLLLGDDMLPRPETLAAHLALARGREVAVQGRIDWDPSAPLTRVMDFLAPAGPQFYFKGLEDRQQLPYTAVLASNLSAPRDWFIDEPFDERFVIAGFEDTELAFRWAQRGRTTVFSQSAVCWHRHHYGSIESFLKRQRRVGQAARLAGKVHPQMRGRTVLQPAMVGALFLVRHGLRTLLGRARQKDAWDLRCRWAFLKGALSGG